MNILYFHDLWYFLAVINTKTLGPDPLSMQLLYLESPALALDGEFSEATQSHLRLFAIFFAILVCRILDFIAFLYNF